MRLEVKALTICWPGLCQEFCHPALEQAAAAGALTGAQKVPFPLLNDVPQEERVADRGCVPLSVSTALGCRKGNDGFIIW